MNSDARIAAARAFARSLNILLKSVRLYGLHHGQTAAHLETGWDELCAAMPAKGDGGFLLGVSGSQLLLDGIPLEAGPVERKFAELLSAAGLASIHFSSRVTLDDFARFVGAFAAGGAKPAALAQELKAALGENGQATIRINEIYFVAQDSPLPVSHHAAQVAAHSLGSDADRLQDWLTDPRKLLQLIAAAEGAHGETAQPSESAPRSDPETGSLQEDNVLDLIRALTQLSQANLKPGSSLHASQFQQQLAHLPETAQTTLREALSNLAAGAQTDTSLLLKLAEHLAIRFALDRYQRGEIRVDAVRELLDRMSQEIETLHKLLGAREEKMSRAGLLVESHADILDRQFWASVPESGKRGVLLSSEAWCIPPRNISLFVEQLLQRDDTGTAGAILLNYASCIHIADSEVRRKTAGGLSHLAELYARTDSRLLDAAIRHVGEPLKHESEPELQSLLSAAFVRLSQEATGHRNYPAVRQALVALEKVEHSQPAVAQSVRPRVGVESQLGNFINEALRVPHVPSDLMDVLRRIPRVAAEQLAGRFSRCDRRDECKRLLDLVGGLGSEGIAHLRETLYVRPAAEGVLAVGLLSRLDCAALEELLPARLRNWNRFFHDAVVRQLARAGAPERGHLLLELFDALDPLAVPQALDEIGVSGDPTVAPHLIRLAGGELPQSGKPYLRVKAVEALGRLREPAAEPLLRRIVETKQLWRWLYPHELRIVAAQALEKIDPEWAQSFLPRSGLKTGDLGVGPIDPVSDTPWVRQRLYSRILLPHALPAAARSHQGGCRIAVKTLSLGGGLATSEHSLPLGTEVEIELRSGFRPVGARVLVREASSQQVSFEIIEIDLEERTRLRLLLADSQFHLRLSHHNTFRAETQLLDI